MKLKHLALAVLAGLLLSLPTTVLVAWHEGYRAYVVRTGSMVPTFSPGDAVLDRTTSGGYTVGDPITLEIGPNVLVTHRLTRIDQQGLLHTKGDANPSADAWQLPATRVRGVVDRVLPNVGYAMVFLQQKTGIAGVMTMALSLVLLWGLCFPPEQEEADDSPVAPSVPRQRLGTFVRIPRQRVPGQRTPAPVAGSRRTKTSAAPETRRTAQDEPA
ncbi:MAG: signal peptidase I [Marmoricola sp.]|nr:signal peptidase I [Marmoricola sp.]